MASVSTESLVDERTPLLPPHAPPPLPPKPPSPPPVSPTAPRTDPPARDHNHYEPLLPPRESALSIPALARAAAALQAGHLPSSAQLLTLFDLLLASPLLDDEPSGTIWEPTYGEGRVGTGALSREGEKVRLAARECVWSARELVDGRNPVLRERGGELAGVTDSGEPGDGWQEFLWRCRGSQLDVELPSAHLPSPSPATIQAASTSLLTLLQLFLTSAPLRALLTDLVLLIRDSTDVLFETAKAKDQLGQETVDALERVVDAAVEGALGASTAIAHDADPEALSRPPGTHAPAADPPVVELPLNGEKVEQGEMEPDDEASDETARQKSPEELKDEFVDRFKAIFVQMQATQAYQGAMHTLLDVFRKYLRDTLERATPHVHVEPAGPSSGPDVKLAPANPDDPTALLIPLLEPFTGGAGSLAPLRASMRALLAHLDPSHPGTSSARLRALAHSLDTFVQRALLTPGWIGTSESHRQLGELHAALTTLGADSPALAADLREFLRRVMEALQAFAGDSLLARALLGVEELARALAGWAAAAGGVAGKAAVGEGVAAVWGDVVEWVVPRLLGVLKEVPLPRIEFASPAISLAIDPPSLLSTSFIPSSLSIRQSTTLTYLPTLGSSSLALPPSASQPPHPALTHASSASRTAYAASTLLSVEGLHLELKDVGYFAQYHTGLPCIGDVTESGLLDLRLGQHGLGFTLAAQVPAPPGAKTLFALDKGATNVVLDGLALRVHRSSHPWMMWLLRPILRAAVRRAVETEVRETLLERGAEWVGRVGWRVRERGEALKEAEKEEARGESEGETARVWRWVRAAWDVLVGGAGADSQDESAEASSSASQTGDDDDNNDDAHPAWHLHLNRHGVAVDLEAANGTVGIGTEGVVIPSGDAPIPPPEGQDPPKGLARAAREEVQREVLAGQAAARGTMRAVGEFGEEAERWEGRVAREKRTTPHSWRSAAFDLR